MEFHIYYNLHSYSFLLILKTGINNNRYKYYKYIDNDELI